jgi:hypothetical protein
MLQPDRFLPTGAAREYLAKVWGFERSRVTFTKWASEGKGPPFQKFDSRHRYYSQHALDEWVQSRLGRKRLNKSPVEDAAALSTA